MTRYFVSRHVGAIAWARKHELGIDVWVDHLDARQVAPGDTVIGSLPIQLVAAICARGAAYRHLQIDVSSSQRGQELDADDLDALGARLVGYRATVCDAPSFATSNETDV